MAVGFLHDAVAAVPRSDEWGVKVGEMLLAEAWRQRYSDLRVLPRRESALVSARADGELVTLAEVPRELAGLLASRLKVMARVPSFVRHKPQDGRIDWTSPEGGEPLVLRVSFMPSLHGESVLIRMPERAGSRMALEELGMPPEVLARVRENLFAREGAILLTGPAGSGKTTTLYAMIEDMHRRHGDRLHFLTIEDPVERDLGFATQIQVNELQDLSFHAALRSALRQDPNVLLIGEIRDAETAKIAMQAGLSGHLAFSTLHAGRAAMVPGRLLSIGLDPWVVASALSAAMAQRLVRCLCPKCRVRDESSEQFAEGPGCAACSGTGHAGRAGIFEYLPVGETLRQLILARAPAGEIAAAAARTRAGDLNEAARRLMAEGRISRKELEYAMPSRASDTHDSEE